jgi:hypothetical protein
MGFLITVEGYKLTDEENEGIGKDYKIKTDWSEYTESK